MTIWSAASQTNILAVHVTSPVAEIENVIELGPFLRFSSFYTKILVQSLRILIEQDEPVDPMSIARS